MRAPPLRPFLLALLVLGALGSIGPTSTYSLVSDTESATSSLTAADEFNNGNGNGGNNGNGNGNGGNNGNGNGGNNGNGNGGNNGNGNGGVNSGNGVTVEAGGPYTVGEGGTVTLDGSSSTTQRGVIRNYEWTIVSGGGSLSTTPQEGEIRYEAPADGTEAAVELTVTTNQGNSDTDVATVSLTS